MVEKNYLHGEQLKQQTLRISIDDVEIGVKITKQHTQVLAHH